MKKALLTAGIAAMIATPALADNTDTQQVTVNGTVIASLEVAPTTANSEIIQMPTLVLAGATADGNSDTSVELTCINGAEAAVYGTNSNPNPSAAGGNASLVSTAACADLNVTGEDGYAVALTFGTVAAGTALTGVTVSDPECYDATAVATSITLGTGPTTISCGATVTSAVDNTATGAYSATFDVTATYE